MKTILFLIVFFGLLYLVGKIGGDCVQECQEMGHGEEVCFNLCRP